MPKGGNGNGGPNTKPLKLEDQSFTTPEITANGTLLGTIVADVNPKKATWSILSGNGDGAFFIDPVTGGLFLADGSKIDYETAQARELVVQVSEGPNKLHSATITVDLTDVNEAPDAGDDQTALVDENLVAGAAVATVTGTDPDIGGGNDDTSTFEDLAYTIQAGNGSGLFAINAATGAITTTGALDFETTQRYDLTVRATDGGGLLNDTVVTVDVGDVNEAPSAGDDVSATVAEDVDDATILASVVASDPDTLNNLSYAITSGNDDDLFAIDGAGNVTLAAGKALDYETALKHVLDVTVTDGGGLADDAQVTITVADVNEAPTNLTISGTEVPENVPNAVVGVLNAEDLDIGDSISFTLQPSGDAAFFEIVGNELRVGDVGLNFESAATRSVTVRATDNAGAFTEQLFTVEVLDGFGTTLTSLTSRDDTLLPDPSDDRVWGHAYTLNSGDDLDGGDGFDSLALFGPGDLNLNNIANFANFEEVQLINNANLVGPPIATLTLRNGTITDVETPGTGVTSTIVSGTAVLNNYNGGDGQNYISVYGSNLIQENAAIDGGAGSDALTVLVF